jgi:hypothetical protein
MKVVLFLTFLGILIAPGVHAEKGTRVQKINFDGSDVDGRVRQPDGSFVTQKKGIEFIPLYKLKESFDEQIQDSVEYIK